MKISDINIDDVRNVDAEAADILAGSIEFIKTLMELRAALDRDGRHDETLYVAIAEDHAALPDLLQNLAIMELLRANFTDSLIAFEQPHNSYQLVSDELKDEPDIYQRGLKNVRSFTENFTSGYAAYTTDLLFRSCLQGGEAARSISYLFTDCAYNEKDDLDPKDQSTAESMKSCNARARGYNPQTMAGLKFRNHHMHKALTEAASAQNARFALQFCGYKHANGVSNMPDSYQDGLCALFKNNAQPFIALFPHAVNCYSANLQPEQSYTRPDIKQVRAICNPDDPEYAKYYQADIDNWQDEKDYIDKKLEAWGLSHLARDLG